MTFLAGLFTGAGLALAAVWAFRHLDLIAALIAGFGRAGVDHLSRLWDDTPPASPVLTVHHGGGHGGGGWRPTRTVRRIEPGVALFQWDDEVDGGGAG